MHILGIDQSTTAPGVCRYVDGRFEVEEWQLPKHSKKNPVLTEDRLDIIEQRFKLELAEQGPYDLVVLEAPAYSRNGTGHSASMGLYWKLRCVLHRSGVPFQEISPTRLKFWATGRGDAEKDDMIAAAKAYFPLSATPSDWTDNMADAAWIAHLSAVVWGDVEFDNFADSLIARQYVYADMTGQASLAITLHKQMEKERRANGSRRVAA